MHASALLGFVCCALVAGPAGFACDGSALSPGRSDASGVGNGGADGSGDALGGADGTGDAREGGGGNFINLDGHAIDTRFQGQHCDVKAACEPGDLPLTSDEECLAKPNSCYVNGQCDDFVACRRESSGGPTRGSSLFDGTHLFFPVCNPGDQQVASAVRVYGGAYRDLSTQCPPGRECYEQEGSPYRVLCMLPEGEHCAAALECKPGDTEVEWVDASVRNPAGYYRLVSCGKSIVCKSSIDAEVAPTVCYGVWSDGTGSTPESSSDGGEAIPGCCGDGHVDPGERCDLGVLNGVWEDCNSACRFDMRW